MEWIYAGILLITIFSIIGASELLRKIFHYSPEVTRKVVHISVGVVVFWAPLIFETPYPAIALSLFFIIVNYISVQMNLFKGMDSVQRKTYGTVYYPLAFLLLIIAFWRNHPFLVSVPMLVLALGDAFAAIVGESVRKPLKYNLTGDNKSVQGSLTMFFVTFLTITISIFFAQGKNLLWKNLNQVSFQEIVLISFLSAIFITLFESLGSYGLDNITIPLSSALILHFLLTTDKIHQFVIAFALAFAIAVISYRLRFLSLNGAVGTFILAVIIFGIGGWKWTVPILAFFVLSSVISKLGGKRKKKFDLIFEKSSTRDLYQVMANGGIAGIMAIIYHFYPNEIFYYGYLASVSAATFDTWATEIGTLLFSRPRLITNLKPVEPGTSGGVSVKGTLGGAFGSAVIFLTATLWLKWNFLKFIIIALSGAFGSLIDSLLGATLQAQYKCGVCSKITEKKFHCNNGTKLIKGKIWINNDLVNFACTLSGAVFGIITTATL